MNLLNKRFKIGTLISESGCPKETAKDWETFYSTFKELDELGNLKDFHVAASSFFASNAKVPEHKRLLSENPDKAKAFLFEHSYDKNDYYLLTSTSALKCDFSEIEMIFIEKKTLVDCLTASSNFNQVSIDKLLTKVTNV